MRRQGESCPAGMIKPYYVLFLHEEQFDARRRGKTAVLYPPRDYIKGVYRSGERGKKSLLSVSGPGSELLRLGRDEGAQKNIF